MRWRWQYALSANCNLVSHTQPHPLQMRREGLVKLKPKTKVSFCQATHNSSPGNYVVLIYWTKSTILLSWQSMSPCQFKTCGHATVCPTPQNLYRVSPGTTHVEGQIVPQDFFPSDLMNHGLLWNGSDWLKLDSSHSLVWTVPWILILYLQCRIRKLFSYHDNHNNTKYPNGSVLKLLTSEVCHSRDVTCWCATDKSCVKLSPHQSVTELISTDTLSLKSSTFWMTSIFSTLVTNFTARVFLPTHSLMTARFCALVVLEVLWVILRGATSSDPGRTILHFTALMHTYHWRHKDCLFLVA